MAPPTVQPVFFLLHTMGWYTTAALLSMLEATVTRGVPLKAETSNYMTNGGSVNAQAVESQIKDFHCLINSTSIFYCSDINMRR